jgi:hypothetical protein
LPALQFLIFGTIELGGARANPLRLGLKIIKNQIARLFEQPDDGLGLGQFHEETRIGVYPWRAQRDVNPAISAGLLNLFSTSC